MLELEKIFQIIVSPELQRALLPLKMVFLFLSALVFGLIIYFLLKTEYLKFLWGEAWEDYLNWKHTYSPKAKKKAHRFSDSTTASSEHSIAPSAPATLARSALRSKPATAPASEEELNLKNGRVGRTDWERVLDKLESNKELNYKLAFIDADKLLNRALDKQGKQLSKEVVSNADDVLKAKEVLEKMLANPKAQLTLKRAKELIAIYQKAVSQLS
jgi:hypothetical protein